MLVITFNVNGIRARIHQLETLIQKYNPDVLCLQEIKVSDEDFPYEDIENLVDSAMRLNWNYNPSELSKIIITDSECFDS